jgi:hypothetical protein
VGIAFKTANADLVEAHIQIEAKGQEWYPTIFIY